MATPTPLNEETAKKVLRQVEFYFSDSNLPKDHFLKKAISESEDGMISLGLICSFSRMRTHLNLGNIKIDEVPEEAVQSVAETLRKSTFLKISEDGKRVARVTEVPKPEEVIEQLDAKTVAASPLPHDLKLEDVQTFFGEHGTVNSVRLPRHVADSKLFSGTALIEFATEEDAEKVLKETLVYAGADLHLIPKKEFDAERVTLAEKFKNYRPSNNNRKNNANANANAEPTYPKGVIVAFKLKSTKTGDSAADSSKEIVAVNLPKTDGESVSTKSNNKEEKNKEIKEESLETVDEEKEPESGSTETKTEEKPSEEPVKGDGKEEKPKASSDVGNMDIVVHEEENPKPISCIGSMDIVVREEENPKPISCIGNMDTVERKEEKPKAASYIGNMDVVMREDLKAVFKKYGAVMFIDFKIGEECGFVRFEEPEAAQKARAAGVLAPEGGLIVKNFVAALEPVTGDAEREYWSLLRGNQEKHRDGFKGSNRGRLVGGRYSRGGGRHSDGKRGRSRDNHNDSSRANKAQKVA